MSHEPCGEKERLDMAGYVPLEPDAMTELVNAAAEWLRGGPNFCESIVQFEFDAFVVTVQKKNGLTPGQKLQEVQAELEAVRSQWQPWNTLPEPGPESEPILAYSQSWDCVWKAEAVMHWGTWHWLINCGGDHVLPATARPIYWMPIPPLPTQDVNLEAQ